MWSYQFYCGCWLWVTQFLSIHQRGVGVWGLWKIPAVSYYAEDATTWLNLFCSIINAPFTNELGFLELSWKYPSTLLRGFYATNYDASESMLRTMLLEWYCTYTYGYLDTYSSILWHWSSFCFLDFTCFCEMVFNSGMSVMSTACAYYSN